MTMFLNFRNGKLTMNEKIGETCAKIAFCSAVLVSAVCGIQRLAGINTPSLIYIISAMPFIVFVMTFALLSGPMMLVYIDEDLKNLPSKDRAFMTRMARFLSSIACFFLVAAIMNHENIHITGDDTGMYEFFSRIAAAFLLNFVYSAIMKPIVAKFVTFKVQPFEEQK